jgi:mRNA-degrading endonuclease toxin of MazEF toxin-antitoxin module
VAPITSKASNKNGIPIKPIKNFHGVIAADDVCSIDKRLLLRKFGRVDDEAMEALQSALLKRTLKMAKE